MDRFDTDNLTAYSAAARELAERKPRLEADLAGLRNDIAIAAGGLTKAQLTARIQTAGTEPGKRATLAELTELYTSIKIRESLVHRTLHRLEIDAFKDSVTARSLNDALDEPGKLAAKLRDATDIAYAIEWNGDEIMAAKYLARYAAQVLAAITNGGLDLREAVLAVTKDAMWQVLSFADNTSLRTGGHGMDDAGEARAAARFIKIAVPVLGDTVPASLLSRY